MDRSTKIDDIADLSIRGARMAENARIRTLGEIADKGLDFWRRANGCGPKTIMEFATLLNEAKIEHDFGPPVKHGLEVRVQRLEMAVLMGGLMDKRLLKWVVNAADGATLANFIDDFEPGGPMAITYLLDQKLVMVSTDPKHLITLTEAGRKVLDA
jgi:hypothetical protein